MEKFYYLMIDTETVGNLDEPSTIFPYDIGFAVIDKKGNVYERFSFIVPEVFFGMAEQMKSCYYAEKISQYFIDLENGTRRVMRFFEIREIVFRLCEKYKIKAAIAHNMRFDYNTLNNATRLFSNHTINYFFPREIKIWCTLTMARQVIASRPLYKEWCKKNKFVTKTGAARCTAEVLYKYITNNKDFEESHTGLEDVLIETVIFAYIIRQHKAMRRTYWKED